MKITSNSTLSKAKAYHGVRFKGAPAAYEMLIEKIAKDTAVSTPAIASR
jgi:hypothetical protein